MTDFFSDLEKHLDDAAKRQARFGRLATLPRPTPASVGAALIVAMVIAAGAFAIPRLAGEDVERAATPGDSGWTAYAPLCGDHNLRAPVYTDAPVPETLLQSYGLLRSDGAHDVEIPERLWGPALWGVHRNAAHKALDYDGTTLVVIPVSDIQDREPRSEGESKCDPPVERPESLRTPGLCLLIQGGAEGLGCMTVDEIVAGRGVIAHPAGDPDATSNDTDFFGVAPDGIAAVRFVGRRTPVHENVWSMSASGGDRPGRVLLEDANGLTPVDRLPGAGAPDNYGCDGPPHAMTLKYFPVLREDGDSVEFKAPEGITFLGGPVLAREVFGQKIWLISAADQADCSKPVVCIVTDFGSDAVACSPVEPDKSTPLVTRIEPGGDPTLLFFAAAPNGVDRVDLVPSGAKSEPVSLDVENGILAGAATLPEAEARALAEAAGGTQWKADPRVTADHDDR